MKLKLIVASVIVAVYGFMSLWYVPPPDIPDFSYMLSKSGGMVRCYDEWCFDFPRPWTLTVPEAPKGKISGYYQP